MEQIYNLLYEPWIPAIDLEGRSIKLGIKDVVLKAHELRDIYDPSPIVTASLYRLLLALLQRIYGPRGYEEWKNLYNKEEFESSPLENYINKWEDRFWLIHDKHPFYQVIEPYPQNKAVSIGYLTMDSVLVGNINMLFDHGLNFITYSLPLDVATRLLVTYQSYAFCGLGSKNWITNIHEPSFKDSPIVRNKAVVIIKGENLFKTFLYNLMIIEDSGGIPAWEVDSWEPGENQYPSGYLDLLTWQSRRLFLLYDERSGQIREFHRDKGRTLADNVRDPMVAYKISEKRGYIPYGFEKDREIWRDITALLNLSRDSETMPPKVINHLAELVEKDILKMHQTLKSMLFGVCAKKGTDVKVHFWRREELPIPLAYLKNEELVRILQLCLDMAEGVSKILYASVKYLMEKISKGKEANILYNHFNPQPYYWSVLEQKFYETMFDIAKLDGIDPQQKAEKEWAITVYKTALNSFHTMVNSLDHSAITLKAITETEEFLIAKLLSEKKSPFGGDFVKYIKEVIYGKRK